MKNRMFFFMSFCFLITQLYSMETKVELHEKENSQKISNPISQNVKNYWCMKCNEFFDRLSFRSHQHPEVGKNKNTEEKSTKVGSIIIPAELIGKNNIKIASYPCEFCQKSLGNAHKLAWHKARDHKVGPYRCSVCKEAFPYLSFYKKHIHERKRNKINKDLQCTICFKFLDNSRYLAIHMASIHQEGHRCDVCNLVFAFPDILKKHGCKQNKQ